MRLAVVICGKIGSGKSTTVAFITSEFGFKAISFGSFVRHMADVKGTPSTREGLQDLGDCLFRSRGSAGLLEDALEYFGVTGDDSVVFDGVRHSDILAGVRQAAETTVAVYLKVNQEERYRRHQARQPSTKSMEEFLAIDQHPVEVGIGGLIEHCDLVVDATRPAVDIQNLLRDRLSLYVIGDIL